MVARSWCAETRLVLGLSVAITVRAPWRLQVWRLPQKSPSGQLFLVQRLAAAAVGTATDRITGTAPSAPDGRAWLNRQCAPSALTLCCSVQYPSGTGIRPISSRSRSDSTSYAWNLTRLPSLSIVSGARRSIASRLRAHVTRLS
jgi:hypothetical protein